WTTTSSPVRCGRGAIDSIRPTPDCRWAGAGGRQGCAGRSSLSWPGCPSTTSRASSRDAPPTRLRRCSRRSHGRFVSATRSVRTSTARQVTRRRATASSTVTCRRACSGSSTGWPTCRCWWSTPRGRSSRSIRWHRRSSATRPSGTKRASSSRVDPRGSSAPKPSRRRWRPRSSRTCVPPSAGTTATRACGRWSRSCARRARGSPSCGISTRSPCGSPSARRSSIRRSARSPSTATSSPCRAATSAWSSSPRPRGRPTRTRSRCSRRSACRPSR
ncbi:MAG: Putative DNA-binding protein, partial [uncultured Solirubrobacteraceae bacterium]